MKTKAGIKICAALIILALIQTIVLPGAVFAAGETYLSDLTPSEVHAHSGVNGGQVKNDAECSTGGKITIAGKPYDKGISFHLANDGGYVLYDLTGREFKTFHAIIGKDDVNGAGGDTTPVQFKVFADDEEIFVKTLGMNVTEEVYLDITGKNVIKLYGISTGANEAYCSVAFADAFFSTQSLKPEIPESPNSAKSADYVSDMIWEAFNGFTDGTVTQKVFRDTDILGAPISFGGETIQKGISMHALPGNGAAYVELNINGLGYTKLGVVLGFPEIALDLVDTHFNYVILGDGVELYRSADVTEGFQTQTIKVDITGVKILKLAVDSGEIHSGDVAVWGGAVLTTGADTYEFIHGAASPVEPTVPETGSCLGTVQILFVFTAVSVSLATFLRKKTNLLRTFVQDAE